MARVCTMRIPEFRNTAFQIQVTQEHTVILTSGLIKLNVYEHDSREAADMTFNIIRDTLFSVSQILGKPIA